MLNPLVRRIIFSLVLVMHSLCSFVCSCLCFSNKTKSLQTEERNPRASIDGHLLQRLKEALIESPEVTDRLRHVLVTVRKDRHKSESPQLTKTCYITMASFLVETLLLHVWWYCVGGG